MLNISFRQLQLLQFIRDCIEHTGNSPDRVEIANALSFHSVYAVEQQLKQLVENKLIEMTPGSPRRQIRLLEMPGNVRLPLVGKIAEKTAPPSWFDTMLNSLTH